ncbi:aminotransferase class I/II-fold pyridoxal phosphate-dependent enzyme [Patescibacteria group bacterium]|nr:aminotransferase class I/II-fold pyridoxal phosphate-dependent enzyme [Patescibacteria group bacterium]
MFKRTQNINLSLIKGIELEATKYCDVVSLALGTPSFDTPDCIKRRVEVALKKGLVAKYSLSPGLPELRELIEITLAKENMYYDWQKEIIVTVGAIEAISATLLTITNPGDEVLIPDPTYTSYRDAIIMAGCKPVYVPSIEKNNWSLNIKAFSKAITPKSKVIFFCNPNNPTGTLYSKESLLGLAEIAERNNLYIMSDEVYKDFILNDDYDDKSVFSLAENVNLRKRVIRIAGFSKMYAMTGWRVGYMHSDASIIQEILKVHDVLVTCAPVVSQYAALGGLEMAQKDVQYFKNEFKKRLDLICLRLDRLSEYFSCDRPDGAYFMFAKMLKEKDSKVFAFDLLKKAQVAVVPGISFGPSGEGYIRFNFGVKEEFINKAFDRIEKYFGI